MSAPRPRFYVSTATVLAAVVALCCALYSGYYVAYYQGTDENGYLLTAKRLALHGDIAKRTADQNEFVSGNWVEAKDGVYYAKYPIGYPLLCTLALKFGGDAAVFLVNPILAVLAVVGIFFLGRSMVNDFAGALAAIFLATNPMHGFYGISALSHSGAICFAVWGMLFVWRWAERGGWWNAILGSALTAYAVSVRYTEALLALPALAMVVWRCVEVWRKVRSDAVRRSSEPPSESNETPDGVTTNRVYPLSTVPWGQLATMLAVAFIVLSPLIVQHMIAYGKPWVSGYTLCGEDTGFGWKWFEKNWRLMLGRLDFPGLFLLFPLGIAGLCYLLVYRVKLGVFLALWTLPGLLLYTSYYWAPEGEGPSYIRFFVSIFPPLIVGAVALLCQAVPSRPGWNVALGLFALLVAGVNLHETTRQLDRRSEGLRFSKQLCDQIRERIPGSSVILSEEHALNFIEYAGDYRLYSSGFYDRGAMQSKIKVLRDDEPHPFHRAKAKDIEKWLGKKTDTQLNEALCDELGKHIESGRRVFVVTSQGSFARWRGRLSERYQFQPVAECVDVKQSPKGDLNIAPWSVYELSRLDADQLAVTRASRGLETKLDQLRFRVEAMRSEYNQQYPGARDSWAKINDVEKQMRDLQEELKKVRAKERAVAQQSKQQKAVVQ